MSIEEKEAKIIDLNLFSGSADTFRTALGGYFEMVETDFELASDSALLTTVGEEPIFQKYTDATFFDGPMLSPFILQQVTDASTAVTDTHGPSSTTVVVPNYTYVAVFWADPDTYIDDNHWKTYWLGGSHGDVIYPTIYNETVWDDYWFETTLPYSQLEANVLIEKDSVVNILNISSQYNYYLPQYQEFAASMDSELLIPNMYLIEMFNSVTLSDVTDPEGLLTSVDSTTSRIFDSTIQNFVSLEGIYNTTTDDSPLGNINELLADINTSWGEEIPDYVLHGYLSQSAPLNPLSASTNEYVKNALQNIFFDEYSMTGGGTTLSIFDITDTKALFPYYVDISFPMMAGAGGTAEKTAALQAAAAGTNPSDSGHHTYLVESLTYNNYSSKILMLLKEAFSGEIETLLPQTQEYVLSQNYQEASEDEIIDSIIVSTENTSFQTIDYIDLLIYGYKNYKSTNNNCYFVGERLIERETAMGTNESYAYLNSKSTLGVLEQTLNVMRNEDISPMGATSNLYYILNGWTNLLDPETESSKYNETIAYRIEKVAANPSGILQTPKVLQNYWIFNSLNESTINLYDSQVVYGKEYTYNIYAYIVSLGVEYRTSDLRLSRQINFNEDASTPWCLEYYNPTTGETADQLVSEDYYEREEDLPGSIDESYDPAQAQMRITYQPKLKIFEVPMGTKTLKVLDNPPNKLTINPFFLLDASQTIGYEANQEAFVEQPYPKTISSADVALEEEYLNTKNLLDGDILTNKSISQQRFLQAYRVDEIPTSFEDFDGSLISTIDLKLKDSIYTLSNSIFYDMIKTNHKYYYVFRVLNENLMPGWLSEIYEAELINDGGYTYPNFEVLFEEDLQEETFTNPSISFKKLIQLQPNMSQVALNDELIDYNLLASEQIGNMSLGDADELIWGKTFKIRLTSKKTGRKMDLNVTYKYERESN